MSVSTATDTFLDLARRSGAVDARRLDAFLRRLPDPPPDSPSAVADLLIQNGLMTRYHAEPLLKGKVQRFVLSGKYRVLDKLGAGGMASVFLAEHRVMRRRVAIKVLPPNMANNPAAVDRFHREARAVAALHHPNIVSAFDVDVDGNFHFLVTEFVDGRNLHEMVRLHGPLSVERAAHYTAQAALGLHHAHEKGMVHRDIKPANLLLDRTGTVKILDMGLALLFHEEDDGLTKEHDASSILGTAEFLAPEQAMDSHAVDIRADIYSLGMTLYFMLSGKTPYGEGTTAQKLIWHQIKPPKPLRDYRPDVSDELWAVIARMLAKDPKDRFQSPAEVVNALAPWTGTPVPPPAESEMPRPLIPIGGDGGTDGGYSYSGQSMMSLPAVNLPSALEAPPSAGRLTPPPATTPRLHASPLSSPGAVQAVNLSPEPMSLEPPAPADGVGSLEAPPPSRPPAPPTAAEKPAPTPPPAAAPKSAPPATARPSVTPPAQPAVKAAAVPAVAAKAEPPAAKSPVKAKATDPAPAEPKSGSKPNVKPVGSKKKKKEDAKKQSKTLLLAGVGGLAAVLVGGGLIWALTGSSDPAPTFTPPTQTGPVASGGSTPSGQPPRSGTGPLSAPPSGLANAATGGKATASSEPAGGEAPGRAFDNNKGTRWRLAGSDKSGWIQYDFGSGKAITVRMYRLAVGDPSPRAPRSWSLSGSNDVQTWTRLDTRDNQSFPSAGAELTFTVADPARYRYYRLNINATGDQSKLAATDRGIELAELALYAVPGESTVPTPPTRPSPPTVPSTPPTKPATPPTRPAEGPTVAADFLPLTAREQFYDAFLAPPAAPPNQPWRVIRQKLSFKADGSVDVSAVKQGAAADPTADPAWLAAPARKLTPWRVRQAGGMIELGVATNPNNLKASQDKDFTFEPLLKVGARLGDSWKLSLPNGDSKTFTVTAFGTRDGKASVTVRSRVPGTTGDLVTDHTFVRGVGEVERSTNVVLKDMKSGAEQSTPVSFVKLVEP